MKEYDVKITETLEKTVTVEAKSRADAEEQVRSAYYNSEYILDSENFTGVEFGTTEEREIQQEQAETMTVLLVKPHMYPQQVQIGCDLEDMQKAVGGDIEAVYPFNEPVALVMHDEGKIMGKDLNRALRDGDGEIYDIIAGDFLVVGLGEEDFSSLSPELMKQFEEHFHHNNMQLRQCVRRQKHYLALLHTFSELRNWSLKMNLMQCGHVLHCYMFQEKIRGKLLSKFVNRLNRQVFFIVLGNMEHKIVRRRGVISQI